VTLAHKIALSPSHSQEQAFRQFAGCHRTVYNCLLASWRQWWTTYYKAQAEGRGSEVEKPTWGVLKATFNQLRLEVFPWMAEPLAGHRDCWSQPFTDLRAAYQNKFDGHNAGPKFKARRRSRPSFYVANDKLRFDGRRVRIPKVGWVKIREALRLPGKIMGARVTQDSDGRWCVSVQVEGAHARKREADKVIGIDLGITHAITLSEPLADGRQFFDAPKPLRASTKRIKRLSQAVARKQKGSKRRQRAVARLGKAHFRVRAIRTDWIHKTTTSILRESQAVGIEDLAVANMLKNHSLARALSDVAMGEMRRQLEYKAPLYRTRVHTADRWFPSSQLCSGCGAQKPMPLGASVYECAVCGLVIDRDVNAARNLTPGLGEGVGAPPAPRARRGSPKGPGARTQPVRRSAHI